MADYINYSSDEGSNDEIGFPKTPGQPLAAHHGDDNSDNESSKASSGSNDSDSEQSDNNNNRKSDSDDDNDKKSSIADQDSDREINKSSDSNSDSESGNEFRKSTNDRSDSQKRSADSDSSDDDENTNKKKVASDSESDASGFNKRDNKRKQTLDSSDDSDQGQNNQKNNTTAKDLFGELSDEDDENKSDQEERNDPRKKARIDDDDDVMQNENMDAINDIFGDGDDDENVFDSYLPVDEDEDKPPAPPTRIDVEIPRIVSDLGESTHFVKLPNFMSIDTHPYDPQWYEDEIDEDEVHDDEGRARLKLKVENTIRWRNVTQEDGTIKKESNARVVNWSDGTRSLFLGDEIFDIQTLNLLPGENNHLFIRQGTGLQGQSVFRTKLQFRPFSTESFTHRKLTLSLADRSQKTQKICVLPSVGKDPEAHRSEMIKKEEDKLKASIRKESKSRRIKDRAYNRGPNSAYLEQDDEDDESISISKIKNQYKRGSAYPGNRYSSDESENEQSSDDSDLDMFEKKKSTEKRKIVDSDEDDDED